jgi:Permuted papain-like amidase enzyme, YaeF/YiiX, C92 family
MHRPSIVALALATFVSGAACAKTQAASQTALPAGLQVRDGDLVFHRSRSSQSRAVALATGSAYTHMGVVLLSKGQPFVLEAVQPVKLTPLPAWIGRGEGGRVVIKRLENRENALTPEVIERMHRLGSSWLGRPYDLQFRWDDERLYCSELVYKLYERAAGIRIGTLRKAKDFNLASPEVRRLLTRRFGGARPSFDPEEIVISPQSMFEDRRLITVFEN